MLHRKFNRVLAITLMLCMFLGCCAFAMEGEASEVEQPAVEAVATEGAAAEADAQAATDGETAAEDAAAESDAQADGETAAEDAEAEADTQAAADGEAAAEDAAAEADTQAESTDGEEAAEEADAGAQDGDEAQDECPHNNVKKYTYLPVDVCEDYGDDIFHRETGYLVTYSYCEDCETELERIVDSEKSEYYWRHRFYDGVCIDCGAKGVCPHDNFETYTRYEDAEYEVIEGNALVHSVTGYPVEIAYCLNCGDEWCISRGEEITTTQDHNFSDGRCYACGYVNTCAHENVIEESYYDPEYCVYIQRNAQTHTIQGRLNHYKECSDCGEILQEYYEDYTDAEITEYTEEHSFENGVCVECGYKNECIHRYTNAWEYVEDASCTPVDAEKHVGKGDLVREVYCLTCDETISREVVAHDAETAGAHVFMDGACVECGYESKCTHAHTEEDSFYDWDNVELISFDADGHTCVMNWMVVQTICTDCGEVLSEKEVEVEGEEETEPHDFMGDACTVCGYETSCTHENSHVDEETIDTMVLSKDSKGHKVSGYHFRNTVCDDCGSTIEMEHSYNKVWTEGHNYKGGSCTVCGYKNSQTTPDPTPTMPAATDEPKATAAPAAAPKYEEVPVEGELKIAETMIMVAGEAVAQGETIRIVNAEKVLTAEELTALNALPIKEQLLTFLSSIGFEAQVNRALEAAGESLSPEATALKEQIQARFAAMDADARAAFEAMLLECFPQEVIVIDGVEYSFFVLELEVRTGDSVRYERYGFRREGDDWIFTRLEIAK